MTATPASHRVLTEVAQNFVRFQLVAQREAEQEAVLGRVPDVVATVPYFDDDIYDLAGLLALGRSDVRVSGTGEPGLAGGSPWNGALRPAARAGALRRRRLPGRRRRR